MATLIEVQDLRKVYKSRKVRTEALKGVDLSIESGDFVSVMGPSGSGKSTLLNLIATIDTISGGKILFNDKPIGTMKTKELAEFRRDSIGFLFQEYNLLDHLTVLDNIALPLTFDGLKSGEINTRVRTMSELLGIEDQLNKYPYELSGGQKQRVAAARAMIKKPSIILADEPTGALDSKSSNELLKLLKDLNVSHHMTILMVTHDPVSASYSDRVVFLKDGKDHSMLYREKSREVFYQQILDQLAYLGVSRYENP